MAALGVHHGLSPVLDVVRDYRWGRVEETIGEDPYLVALLGAAYVRGLQSAGVIATLKHFAGYSASRGARNHGPVSMGRRELIDAGAGALALAAGIDVELPDTIGYGDALAAKVRAGEVAEELVDRAARRVLIQKAGTAAGSRRAARAGPSRPGRGCGRPWRRNSRRSA